MLHYDWRPVGKSTARIVTGFVNLKAPYRLSKRTQVKTAQLPFYGDHELYALIDHELPPPNIRYALIGEARHDIHLMNWTNEPIYRVNEWGITCFGPETLPDYARFFFHFVRGQKGRFIIAETPDAARWLQCATYAERRAFDTALEPIMYLGLDSDGLFNLTATVIFQNALFRTDIRIASRELKVFDPEEEEVKEFSIGQIELVNEQLLLEDLNLVVDGAPGEFG